MSSTSLKVAAALAGVAAVAALVRSFTRPKAGKLAGTTVDVAPPLVGKRAGGGTLTPAEVTRLLDVIERDIVPLTTAGVAVGNKVFGGAILRRSDLSLVVASTNREQTTGPVFHGEVSAIQDSYGVRPRVRPEEVAMLATHEPCSMCASAIAFSGIKEVIFLFSFEDSRDSFAIPHDLKILKEVFGVTRPRYPNQFFTAINLAEVIRSIPHEEGDRLRARYAALNTVYAGLNDTYQAAKVHGDIPLK